MQKCKIIANYFNMKLHITQNASCIDLTSRRLLVASAIRLYCVDYPGTQQHVLCVHSIV